jgi:hypothetical protein
MYQAFSIYVIYIYVCVYSIFKYLRIKRLAYICICIYINAGYAVAQLVEALRY